MNDYRGPKVTKMVRTSDACPSQWDLWLEDGSYVYVRYRHGYFGATAAPNEGALRSAQWDNLADLQPEDGSDGYMTDDTMKAFLSDKLDFSDV